MWFCMAVSVPHLMAWCGVLADNGPLAPGGWAAFVMYLACVAVGMLRSNRETDSTTGPASVRVSSR